MLFLSLVPPFTQIRPKDGERVLLRRTPCCSFDVITLIAPEHLIAGGGAFVGFWFNSIRHFGGGRLKYARDVRACQQVKNGVLW